MKKLVFTLAFIGIYLYSSGQKGASVTFNPNSGYVNTTEIIPALGISRTDVPFSKYYIGIVNISSYQIVFKNSDISRKLNLGIGAGVLFYNDGFLLPAFLDFRFFLNEKTLTPFVFASGGGLIHLDDFNNQSRLFVNPGLGIRHAFSETFAIDFGGGAFIQSGSPGRDAFLNLRLGLTIKP